MTSSQSFAKKRPSMISWPAGVCIQLLADNIQNEENIVPSATISARRNEPKAVQLASNKETPRKAALEEKCREALVCEERRSTLAVASAKRLQFVPN